MPTQSFWLNHDTRILKLTQHNKETTQAYTALVVDTHNKPGVQRIQMHDQWLAQGWSVDKEMKMSKNKKILSQTSVDYILKGNHITR